ncbi:hypothetical protein FEM48_Zijuj06G0111200 [Ziziphus jujuba var. spinosa]|uniref:Bifunctional dethiobiotin synthetase/7,8-diamino-pelargonic acid aminotransferase, mitochondrial-like n=1 Tax=Ziziphus jujuba var. spinosa TaxID=714518 RepID=A0A978V8X6_ZIZJJ|nr:hypothetical protein FEM48_Zijuj06G0111200 [Ziziphus jujuba var. spinosa]
MFGNSSIVIQAAGGMHMVDPLFQRVVVNHFRNKNMPIIFDEVFTGFWRLGTETAVELFNCVSDIACFAKLMTGGAKPLAATLATSAVFDSFLGDSKVTFNTGLNTHIQCTAAAKSIKWFTYPQANNNITSGGRLLKEVCELFVLVVHLYLFDMPTHCGMKKWWVRYLHILQLNEQLHWEPYELYNFEQKALLLAYVLKSDCLTSPECYAIHIVARLRYGSMYASSLPKQLREDVIYTRLSVMSFISCLDPAHLLKSAANYSLSFVEDLKNLAKVVKFSISSII